MRGDVRIGRSIYGVVGSLCSRVYGISGDRHCTSNIAINISIFHLGRARIYIAPTRRGAERSAPPIVEATAHRGRAVNLRACALAI